MRRPWRGAGVLLLLGLGVPLAAGCGASRKERRLEQELAAVPARSLYERGLEHLARRDLKRARQVLERIEFMAEPAQRQDLEPLVRLGLADVTFYQFGDLSLIDARSLYLDFVTLYGSHPLAAYAQLQAGLCSLRQVYAPSRDQTQTRQAIADLSDVQRRWPNSIYARAAADLLREAEGSLAEHDFLVGKFYLDKKAYEAAAERFREVLRRYPGFTDREKLLYHLGHAHLLNKNTAEGSIYLDQLVSEYPDSPFAAEARKLLASMAGERRTATPDPGVADAPAPDPGQGSGR